MLLNAVRLETLGIITTLRHTFFAFKNAHTKRNMHFFSFFVLLCAKLSQSMEEVENEFLKKTQEQNNGNEEKECPQIPDGSKKNLDNMNKCRSKLDKKENALKERKTKVYGGSFIF
ncbi:hypothetical protein THOM_3188 [Trachipleistophora hominis]|uniref:Uncharacterized protein n=1 Tax=Trachipleistophora hominis TaxID=72359 RepID=L7JRJ6_TRAHO|nr:hypothetical protein THOM_3188 [Trachipleistophora hominis]